jgi:hypothetical protein
MCDQITQNKIPETSTKRDLTWFTVHLPKLSRTNHQKSPGTSGFHVISADFTKKSGDWSRLLPVPSGDPNALGPLGPAVQADRPGTMPTSSTSVSRSIIYLYIYIYIYIYIYTYIYIYAYIYICICTIMDQLQHVHGEGAGDCGWGSQKHQLWVKRVRDV